MSQYPPGSRRSAARKQHRPVCLRDYWAVPAEVLVVEDDRAIAEMIGIVLAGQSLRPCVTGSGERAITEFMRSRPRLVLLDLVLPDIDGVAVCKAIRALAPTPIVVVSASRDPEMIAAVMAAGADDYLLKPFTIRQLVKCVDAHLPATSVPTPISLAENLAEAAPVRSPQVMTPNRDSVPAPVGTGALQRSPNM